MLVIARIVPDTIQIAQLDFSTIRPTKLIGVGQALDLDMCGSNQPWCSSSSRDHWIASWSHRAATITIWALLILSCQTSRAFEGLSANVAFGQHLHQEFARSDGLTCDWINRIVQTRDNYIWVGTDNGLLRYDGSRFKVFDRTNVPQMPFHEIRALYEDTDGSLWIGTTRGAARYRLGTPARFESLPTFAEILVWTFFRDRRGVLWIGTEEATYVSQDGIVFERLEDAPQNVRTICEDRDGTLWLGSHEGLFYREGATYQQVIHERLPKDAPPDESVPTRRVNAIYCDQGGDLWIGTNRALLRMRNRQLTTCGEEVTGQQIYDIRRVRNGQLYVAARFGVYRMVDDQTFERVVDEPSAFCLLEDHQDALWIGHGDNRGLHRFRNSHQYPVGGGRKALCVHADTKDNVWFGTATGLCRLRAGAIEEFGTADGLPDPRVMTIAQARDESLWIGTPQGLVKWSNEGRVDAALPATVQHGNIGLVMEDSTGTLWLAPATEKAYRLQNGQLEELQALKSRRTQWFWEQSAGTVWIGHEAGLFQYREGHVCRIAERELSLLQNPRILCHWATANGTLWVGTSNGLARYQSGRWHTFPPDCGLQADNIERLAVDDVGNLWFGGRDGLFHAPICEFDAVADGRAQRITSYRVDGFERFPPIRPFSQGCIVREGELWLVQEGLVRLQTRPLLGDRPLPSPHVELIAVDNTTVSFGEHFAYPSGKRRISFRFAGQPFTDAEHSQFRYRLDPFDDQWTMAGEDRVADYANLTPGNYAFRVAARHGNGPWREAERPPTFSVTPRWWETVLFRCALGLMSVGICLSYARFRTRRIRRANQLLRREIVSRERAQAESREYLEQLTRVSRATTMGELVTSITHQVKQPVFAILTDAETATRLLDQEKPDVDQIRDALRVISAGGRQVTEIVDRITSLVRRQHQPMELLDLNKVVSSVIRFLDAELAKRSVDMQTRMAEELPPIMGNAIELQQALLNLIINGAQAMGHTEIPQRILSVATSVHDGVVELTVCDRGVGLDESVTEKLFEPFHTTKEDGIGIGLAVSRTIVRAHGGRIWATQNAERGATFHIALPTARQAVSHPERKTE